MKNMEKFVPYALTELGIKTMRAGLCSAAASFRSRTEHLATDELNLQTVAVSLFLRPRSVSCSLWIWECLTVQFILLIVAAFHEMANRRISGYILIERYFFGLLSLTELNSRPSLIQILRRTCQLRSNVVVLLLLFLPVSKCPFFTLSQILNASRSGEFSMSWLPRRRRGDSGTA